MKPSLPLAQPPKSICILRLSAIGDCTHVVPMVRTIQKHWPG
ncbi:MAG: glycosyl transferase, partial [Planctomycetota bacterium]|nr:glycosyl transferase [Planctomycetota bacterium]